MKKDYKNFILKSVVVLAFTVVAFLIFLVFLSSKMGTFAETNVEADLIQHWAESENKLYQKIGNRKKIVFVSGSNSLYGINFDTLNKNLKYPVLNYANNAGLCTYIFERAKKVLNKGDIVIMPLEYDYYKDIREVMPLKDSCYLGYIIGYDRNYYKTLPLEQKIVILDYFLRKYFIKMSKTNKKVFADNTKFGIDETTGNMIPNKTHIFQCTPFKIVSADFDFKNVEKWGLYDFIMWCKERNIKIYAAFPSCHLDISDEDTISLENKIRKFYKELDIEVLGNAKENLYAQQDLYNTPCHLNHKARDKRTKILLKQLKLKGL